MNESQAAQPALLLIGASRGLGHAMAEEFVLRGWNVVGTVRGDARTPLHALHDAHPRNVTLETLDITDAGQLAALAARLAPRRFDVLFVNAGTANRRREDTIADASDEEFTRVMQTNALGPLRAIEALAPLVGEHGLVGVMSSGQGSVANNQKGGHELYRASKAALNTLMRSYAARTADRNRPLLLLAPGWIRTELGGPDAPSTVAQAIPGIVDVIIGKQGRPGLEYLDRQGMAVPW